MGIDAYITVYFYLGIAAVVIHSCNLVGDHPRTKTYSVGTDTFCVIWSMAFLAWTSYLKFGA